MKIVTKLSVGDVVHFMYDGKPATDVVKEVRTTTTDKCTEESYLFESHDSLDVNMCYKSSRELAESLGLVKKIVRTKKIE